MVGWCARVVPFNLKRAAGDPGLLLLLLLILLLLLLLSWCLFADVLTGLLRSLYALVGCYITNISTKNRNFFLFLFLFPCFLLIKFDLNISIASINIQQSPIQLLISSFLPLMCCCLSCIRWRRGDWWPSRCRRHHTTPCTREYPSCYRFRSLSFKVEYNFIITRNNNNNNHHHHFEATERARAWCGAVLWLGILVPVVPGIKQQQQQQEEEWNSLKEEQEKRERVTDYITCLKWSWRIRKKKMRMNFSFLFFDDKWRAPFKSSGVQDYEIIEGLRISRSMN